MINAVSRRALMTFGAMLCALPALAQTPAYPSKTVRVIVPYPAGGPTDVIARVFSQKAQETFGQSFVVENINGASGMVGAGTAANAPADGHTLLFTTND